MLSGRFTVVHCVRNHRGGLHLESADTIRHFRFQRTRRFPSLAVRDRRIGTLGALNVTRAFHNSGSRTSGPRFTPELEGFTSHLLNARRAPLGTLTEQQWDEALLALRHWLPWDGDASESEEDAFRRERPANGTPAHVAFYGVDSVGRLLDRLVYEVASGQSVTSRRRERDLAPWILVVLRGWLYVLSLSPLRAGAELHPLVDWALDRAIGRWNQIVVWKGRGWWHNEEWPLSDDFVSLVRACLRLETAQGVEQAAVLLSGVDSVLDAVPRESIVFCYHEALRQAIRFADVEATVASKLTAKMESMAEQPGWDAIRPDAQQMRGFLENYFRDSDDRQHERVLSAFEAKALQGRILQVIENATESDMRVVEDLIGRWNAVSAGEESLPQLAQTVCSYFLRIKDHKNATHWLRRLDQMSGDAYPSKPTYLRSLFQLWVVANDPEAPWRADELLEQLEKLASEKNDSSLLDASAYAALADCWLRSGEARANKKALAILRRSPRVDSAVVTLTLKANLLERKLSRQAAAMLLKLLMDYWAEMTTDDRCASIEYLGEIMETTKTSAEVVSFAEFLVDEGISPSPVVCERMLNSFSVESHPDEVLRLFDLLESVKAPLTFACYRSGVRCLLTLRQKQRIQQTTNLLARAMSGVATGLVCPEKDEDVGALLLEVLEMLTYWQRESDALEVLGLAERELLSSPTLSSDRSPIPLTCYRRVMTLLAAKNKTRDVESIFGRLKVLSEAGFSDLAPDAAIYTILMNSLARNGASSLERQQALLNELIELYKSTGELKFKPSDRMFNVILTCIKERVGPSSAATALELVETMVLLGVEVRDAYGFNTAMHVVLECETEDAFVTVLKIFQRLVTSKVEPDHFTYHDVLRACGRAQNQERDRALKTALEAMEKLRTMGKADAATYNLLVRVARRVLVRNDKLSERVVATVFEICCVDGYLNDQNREILKSLVSSETWRRIYDGRLLAGNREPSEWSRNVVANEARIASR